jgi:hypothetical protein
LVPWRAPSVLVIYASATVEPSAIEVVTAEGKDDANVLWITPRDRSVFAIGKPPALPGLPLADPTQILWDLRRLGGSDRVEAAERLRRWLLSR